MAVMASNQVYEDENGRRYNLIIENDDLFHYYPGEKESLWHEATDAEYQEYLDYYKQTEE